jgi:ribonuclease HII
MLLSMIVGIDEVGRGCWAGPVVAGAVLLQKPMRGLKDSKKLTRLQREMFDIRIRKTALAVGIGWVWVEELDAIGMTEAVRLAMRRALEQIERPYEQIIIDGNYNYLKDNPMSVARIKADDSVPAVSAASIVAKVARDAWMRDIAGKFPQYGFDSHVGYGTKMHRDALAMHGVCELHRRSFLPVQSIMQTVG